MAFEFSPTKMCAINKSALLSIFIFLCEIWLRANAQVHSDILLPEFSDPFLSNEGREDISDDVIDSNVRAKSQPTNGTQDIVKHYGDNSTLTPWSIIWYIGSFGGLVAFFLVVSCSEWCCRRGALDPARTAQRAAMADCERQMPHETPPPSYHLFAPPPYDAIFAKEKPEYAIYVVPVDKSTIQDKPAITQSNQSALPV